MTTHNANNERIKRRYFAYLKEAKRLEITVDFADGFDSGDRALLGNPVLVKSGT